VEAVKFLFSGESGGDRRPENYAMVGRYGNARERNRRAVAQRCGSVGASQLPSRLPGVRPFWATSSAAILSCVFVLRLEDLDSSSLSVTKKFAADWKSHDLAFYAPKVRNTCLRLSKICSFFPFSVVHAPGAGLHPYEL